MAARRSPAQIAAAKKNLVKARAARSAKAGKSNRAGTSGTKGKAGSAQKTWESRQNGLSASTLTGKRNKSASTLSRLSLKGYSSDHPAVKSEAKKFDLYSKALKGKSATKKATPAKAAKKALTGTKVKAGYSSKKFLAYSNDSSGGPIRMKMK